MKLTKRLEGLVANMAIDVQSWRESDGYKSGFIQYLLVLDPSLERYHHHLGYRNELSSLQKRYEHEVALIHVLTSTFANIAQQHFVRDLPWPVYDEDSPYQWYRISHRYSADLAQLSMDLSSVDSIEELVTEICVQVLVQSNRRTSGEYYTPLPIARHLVDLSGLNPSDLMAGKSVVDPACGSGIILALIVKRTIATVLDSGEVSPQMLLENLSEHIFGFDVQPFAVCVTRTLLLYICLPVLARCGYSTADTLFPCVKLQDALVAQEYWLDNKKFDYIIGNPPFFPAKKDHLDYAESYKEILYGHPNLYQLFLWWAIRASREGGVISFLVPQSMLSGHYYRNLREHLDKSTRVISITRMINRNVVGDADQLMMAICLQVAGESTEQGSVQIRVSSNGDDISISKPHLAKHNQVVRRIGIPLIWVVSDSALDYAICDCLETKCVTLESLKQIFEMGNGEYVWNQHKNLVLTEHRDSSIPLISAASIRPYGFSFPYSGSHSSRARQFSLVDQSVEKLVHDEQVALIQRITPRKTGRRLLAGVTSEAFHLDFPKFFIENHVNYVKCREGGDSNFLYGFMGWLNCDLVNFVFQLRNGTVQVSLSDLEILPADIEIIQRLASIAKPIVESGLEDRDELIRGLNLMVYEWIGLKPQYIRRIEEVLNREE